VAGRRVARRKGEPGSAAVHGARTAPAVAPTLTIAAAARRLDALRAIAGKERRCAASKRSLACSPRRRLGAAVSAGLLLGELRQGALEGVATDAIAAAADVPVADVRRASMLAGSLVPVASAALAAGRAGLERFRLTLMSRWRRAREPLEGH
jgi:DNA ligase-1